VVGIDTKFAADRRGGNARRLAVAASRHRKISRATLAATDHDGLAVGGVTVLALNSVDRVAGWIGRDVDAERELSVAERDREQPAGGQ